MSHYDLTVWTDYARGLVSAEASAQMSRHLGQCTLCAYVANLLQRASETGAADRDFEPPVAVVAAAEGIFPGAVSQSAPAKSGRIWAGLRQLAGELRQDSLEGAVPQGVRSLRPDSRHMTYQAGHYSVDLWFDSDPANSAMTVTGQIADETAPDVPMRDTKALLLAGNQLLASTTTTEFGEFSLRYKPGPTVRLFMPVERSGEYVEVSLNLPGGEV